MKIKLSNSLLCAEIDDKDFEKISGYKWYLHSEGYVAAPDYHEGIPGTVYMHKLIVPGKLVDHRDRDKLNNRKSNLRCATRSQNNGNRIKQSRLCSSRFKGVYWEGDRRKWAASIKKRRLGRFDDEISAAKAYNEAAKREFGEFALLNNV